MKIGKIAVVLAAVFAVALGTAQASYVTIGDAGNTADGYVYGDVSYEYKISDTEVTIAEFQASGAGDGDENYWNDGTRTVGTAAPASYVSLYEARKYCNWLTTGDVDSGYYGAGGNNMSGLSHDAYAAANGVTYFMPTEDEWYKAAYYTGSGYSDYANGSDTQPAQDDGSGNGWNYYDGGYVYGSPNYVRETDVGATEQNGTRDMMGNVQEWQEDTTGVHRGGAYSGSADNLRSSDRITYYVPTSEYANVGFRVVAIPEPVSGGLFVLVVGLWWFVRRRARA